MNSSLNAKILADPNYWALIRQRRRFVFRHGMLMLVVYFGFIGLTAFKRDFMAQPIFGGIATVGLAIGAGVVVFSLWIAWRYTARARVFDDLTHQIIQDLKRCPR